jgi:hypothetical protein
MKYPCHTDILNAVAKRFQYQDYLEIGICNPDDCFNTIICPNKTGVDPAVRGNNIHSQTSDDYFAEYHEKFDLIFVDGLHEDNRVFRDITNSLERLNPGGMILAHDCLPESDNDLLGSCYKAIMRLRMTRDDINIVTLDTCTGIAVVTPGKSKLFPIAEPISLQSYLKYRKQMMNITNLYDWCSTHDIELKGFKVWTDINPCWTKGGQWIE